MEPKKIFVFKETDVTGNTVYIHRESGHTLGRNTDKKSPYYTEWEYKTSFNKVIDRDVYISDLCERYNLRLDYRSCKTPRKRHAVSLN